MGLGYLLGRRARSSVSSVGAMFPLQRVRPDVERSRHATGGLLLAGVLAVVGACGVAVPAVAADGSPVAVTVHADRPSGLINKGLVGSNEPIEYPDAVKDASDPLMRALRPRYIRTFAHFDLTDDQNGFGPYYDCATGAWPSGPLDRELAHIRAQGAKPMIVVGRAPSCITGQLTQDTSVQSPSPLALDGGVRWSALVRKMAVHAIRAGVRTFEVWNEPELVLEGMPSSYVALYAVTARVLEKAAADAHVKIEIGGPASVLPGTGVIAALLDAVTAQDLPLDFVSWHWYANIACSGLQAPCPQMRTQIYGEQIAAVKALLAKYPTLHPKMWIDEWNTTFTNDSYFSVSPYGAAYVTSALDAMQQAGLDRSTIFLSAGSETGSLIQKDGTRPGPEYRAMAYWAAQAKTRLAVSLSPDQTTADATGRVGAVGATGPTGRTTVLLYNFAPFDPSGNDGRVEPTSFPHPVTVHLKGLARGRYTWTRSLTDNGHANKVVSRGTVRGPSATLRFRLSQNAISLVTLCRSGKPPRCAAG